jgi:hypothetical protein
MFPQHEIAQFGVNARPLTPLSPNTKLVLINEDPRTPEEKERDLYYEPKSLREMIKYIGVGLPDRADLRLSL